MSKTLSTPPEQAPEQVPGSVAELASELESQDLHNQFGALCWRAGKTGAEVLLISSRETGRWVIPKGWPMKGRTGAEAAEIEAWEEAGVKGKITPAKLGHFTYDKILQRDTKKESAKPCIVDVFTLEVTKLASEFPEQRQRRRKWFAPQDAARKVAEEGLKSLLAAFNPPVPTAASSATDQGADRAKHSPQRKAPKPRKP